MDPGLLSELRIVLLGQIGVGKSSTGNTILGGKEFTYDPSSTSTTQQCEKGTIKIRKRTITVVDTPGFLDTRLTEEVETHRNTCLSLCVPGPHAFLLVVKLGAFTENETRASEQIQELFGEKVLRFTLVLFTCGDELQHQTIEEFIEENRDLQSLVQQFGGRYHLFNNNYISNRKQVRDLLEKIDLMVKANKGGYYSREIHQKEEEFIGHKEWRLKEGKEQKKLEKNRIREEIQDADEANNQRAKGTHELKMMKQDAKDCKVHDDTTEDRNESLSTDPIKESEVNWRGSSRSQEDDITSTKQRRTCYSCQISYGERVGVDSSAGAQEENSWKHNADIYEDSRKMYIECKGTDNKETHRAGKKNDSRYTQNANRDTDKSKMCSTGRDTENRETYYSNRDTDNREMCSVVREVKSRDLCSSDGDTDSREMYNYGRDTESRETHSANIHTESREMYSADRETDNKEMYKDDGDTDSRETHGANRDTNVRGLCYADKETDSKELCSADIKKHSFEKQCREVINRLGIEDFYPHKMTKSEILVIGRSSLHDQTPLKEKYLPFAFLERLLMLDYRARELIVKDDNYESGITEDDFSNTEGEREIPSDLENFISKGENDNNTHQIQQAHIHPMDVQMAVFHCADNFLRQYIVTKLSMCQYALPLLVPNPITGKIDFPLWTFRQIIKSWKASNSNTVNSSCMPIYKAKTPMVFFFRLGPVSVSKSQLLNSMINRQKHNTFFHRQCSGSSKSRLLLDGVVEILWYCPSGKDDDIFNDCIAFCNLHGNAEEHQEQKNSLIDASSVNVVFLPDFNLDDNVKSILQKLLTSPKPLICLLADAELSLTRVCGNKYKVGLKNRNQAELTQELTKTIQHYLKLSNHTFCLQEYADIAKKNGFRLDEENKDCTKAKLCAKKIIDILKSVKLSKIKEQFLPCQGRLWHDWCEKNKDLHRLHGNIEQTRSKIEEEIKNIRRKQRDFGLHNLMKTFVRNLQTEKPVQKMFFLKWLGILIDEHCSDQLSELHHIYDAKWSEVLDLKQKHDKSDELKNKQVELETISEKLNSAVFGLEHVLREMGQIYEAWESQPDRAGMDIYSFPALAAEIMISGYPIELMDGDAAHVPLKWIDSVLGKVIERLGDQRVFVLSVLGLQSTGKSTMLNAMFGLQFAVSAGRCTRGAFMQLVKVNEEVKEELQFDYMLVVDTEGLRALELAGKSTLNHDNELATFVIGLGNMTLINIFGENPAEMQDILQISVQAFLRMKKVRLTPSCMFVHQNVGEITAGEKNMEGKRRLQEKLDEMACLAAKEEVCDVVQFNDVIKFDVKRDVQYFAQLWEGNPPMAPPNPRYSENVQELKQIILSNGAQHKSLNLSEFKFRIKDLWRALLNENFVFSFKNTLEITTYRKLERMYGNWTWKLRSAMLAIENKLHNRIENGKLETVDRSYLIQEITATFENVRREMENFFAEDVDKEMLVEWRGKTELKIEDLKNDLIEGTKRKFDELIQLKSSCKRLDNEKTQYENQLFNKSKEMASALRNKGNDTSDLKKEFDSLWKQWVLSLTSKIPQIKDIDIEEDVMKTLFAFYEERFVKHSKEHRYYKNICIIGDYKDYVKMNRTKRSLGFASYSLKPEDHHSIRNLIQDIVRETEDYIKHKLIAKISYSDSYIYEIVKTITTRITEFESNIKRFVFTKDFNVDVTLFVCDIAVLKFTDLQMAFREANDPLIYLGSKKEDYYSIFKKFFQGATSATVFADFICSKLKPSILQTVYDKTAIDVAGDMRANFPAFSGNRSNLEKHILLVLAEEENFAKFMNYIDNPKKHFKEFITQCVNEHFFKGKDSSLFKMIIHTFQSLFKEEDFSILDIFKQNLELKQRCVSEAISISTVGVKNKNGDVQMWLNTFSSQLADELKFTEKDLKGVLYPDIKDFDFLQEEMTVALQNVIDDLKNGFNSVSSVDMGKFRERPDEILFRQLCGCWVQCPFCNALCTNTMKGHDGDHRVHFHRPQGIAGWHPKGHDILIIDICTSSIVSDRTFRVSENNYHPYKSYKEAGPKYACWSITPDSSVQSYWKWFVCRFQRDLEKHYSKKFYGRGEIPKQWMTITKNEALQSLEEES